MKRSRGHYALLIVAVLMLLSGYLSVESGDGAWAAATTAAGLMVLGAWTFTEVIDWWTTTFEREEPPRDGGA